ncbi:MAG TPA: hypothetical protein VEJ42_09290 [Streptosporangiaceae bacterium]|nr:hypothetical protein [Streptosporangiaceae bacterium]
MRAQAPAGCRERAGPGLVNGGQRGHVEHDGPDGAAADLVRAGSEVFHPVEVKPAGQRHEEAAPGELHGKGKTAVRAPERFTIHAGSAVGTHRAARDTWRPGVPSYLFPLRRVRTPGQRR